MKRFVALALLVIAPIASAQQNPDWLKQAAFYQIYPSSYQDSDGNGIGDIARIQPRLGYLDSLGVNALWLKPVFKSGSDERHLARVGRQRGLIIECRTVSQPLEPRALPDSTVRPARRPAGAFAGAVDEPGNMSAECEARANRVC